MAKHLSIDICLGDDAHEIVRILNTLAATFSAGPVCETATPYPLRDVNGNTIGYAYIYTRPDGQPAHSRHRQND